MEPFQYFYRCTVHLDHQILFIYQQMHFILVLGDIKIYMKIYIKIAPTCFGLRPSSVSLHLSLAKVTFIKSVKVRRYGLRGGVAACCHTTA
jgi:hypothetical protein